MLEALGVLLSVDFYTSTVMESLLQLMQTKGLFEMLMV